MEDTVDILVGTADTVDTVDTADMEAMADTAAMAVDTAEDMVAIQVVMEGTVAVIRASSEDLDSSDNVIS